MEFVINLTTESMAWAVDYAGIYTGAKVDKWRECSLTPVKSKCVAAPTIAESPLSLECKVTEIIPSGTHDIFVADIVNVSCDESILDANGRIELDRAGLLAYAHGEYFALGEKLGKFGFSTKVNREDAKKNAVRTAKNAENYPKKNLKPPTERPKADGSGRQPFYVTAPGYRSKRGSKK